ncbi:hypothetical protein Lalb_Chr13g0299411 [Lupinus albus]|uniref:Uncharacterized protein n=1 Tax=Lupinus albus TaxID=3870 RepID=A0A6A4PJ70_LUPAL|nr:hypothetical protein Lalb_Chr13g0299411 [Lupinus albus]
MPGLLKSDMVRGEIVVCDRGLNGRFENGAVVRNAGRELEEFVAESHLVLALAARRSTSDATAASDRNPTAVLSFGGTLLDVRPSLVMSAGRVETG